MIDISTNLTMSATGFDRDFISEKQVVMVMSADDALALATILLNNEAQVSDDWKKTVFEIAKGLVKAGNACR